DPPDGSPTYGQGRPLRDRRPFGPGLPEETRLAEQRLPGIAAARTTEGGRGHRRRRCLEKVAPIGTVHRGGSGVSRLGLVGVLAAKSHDGPFAVLAHLLLKDRIAAAF